MPQLHKFPLNAYSLGTTGRHTRQVGPAVADTGPWKALTSPKSTSSSL
jgi:hypothetical protein